MQNEYEIKKEMCEIGKRVYNRGMVAANEMCIRDRIQSVKKEWKEELSFAQICEQASKEEITSLVDRCV